MPPPKSPAKLNLSRVSPELRRGLTPSKLPSALASFFISCATLTALLGLLFIIRALNFDDRISPPIALAKSLHQTPPEDPPVTEPRLTPHFKPPVATPPVNNIPTHQPSPPTALISTPESTPVSDFNLSKLNEIAEQEREELERLRRQEESERKRQAELEAQRLAKKKADDEERARKAALLAAKKQQEQARRSKEQAERAQAQRQLAQKQAEARREAALAKKISTKPVVTRKTQPHYPSSARRAGHQGTTRVTFTVTSSGKVTSARIVASSGHRSLDSAALSAVKKWRFSPAKNGLGQAVSYTISNHPVRFQIQ